MEIKLFIERPLEHSAARYYEQAKHAKKKIEGVNTTIKKFQQQREQQHIQEQHPNKARAPQRKQEWYEKHHWFISSEGFLCIGGRDATSNEILIKKHASKDDWVFHTEAPGSPFFIIKTEGKEPGTPTFEECATMTLVYSRAWRLGITTAETYRIRPSQVTKHANTGEYVAKGAFIISGKREYYHPTLDLALGMHDGKIIIGTTFAISTRCSDYFIITPDKTRTSDTAKHINKQFTAVSIDEITRALPSGGCKATFKKSPLQK